MFFVRVPSDKFYLLLLLFIIKVFTWILGASFEIQFLAIFYLDFNKGFNQIWNCVFFFLLLYRAFHWNIRGTLIQNTLPNDKNRSPCLPFGWALVIGREA